MISTSLRDTTLELLQNRPVHVKLTDINKATSLPLGWLKCFQFGELKDPSVNKVQTLYEFLTKTKLIL